MQFFQKFGISLITVQVFQQRVDFYEDQTAVTLHVGAVKPLERFTALIPKRINSSY
jgi:hypothetical protein